MMPATCWRPSSHMPLRSVLLLSLLSLLAACSSSPAPPLADGDYRFTLKDAEFPQQPGFAVNVRLRGDHVSITNPTKNARYPQGLLDEGLLLWHPATQQWIVGQSTDDVTASEVGGCSGGPGTLDLKQKIYWTC